MSNTLDKACKFTQETVILVLSLYEIKCFNQSMSYLIFSRGDGSTKISLTVLVQRISTVFSYNHLSGNFYPKGVTDLFTLTHIKKARNPFLNMYLVY